MPDSAGQSSAAQQPLVSVCMPAYNAEEFLAEALRSVLQQTYSNLEIIVVDDASKDATERVARSFNDPRLRYVRNETNLGGYQTMNKAVTLARGEFVAIYHSDDVYEPEIVEKEAAYLREHPQSGAVFCLDHFMDSEGHIYGGMTMPREFAGRDTFSYEDVFPFFLRNKNRLLRCPTFMARREVFTTVGLFDAERYDIAADLDMWIRILRKYPVGILNERLMRYRHQKGQWSSRYDYLRTEPELCFAILDRYLQEDGWAGKLTERDLAEYAFQRCDDETFRAANQVIRSNPDAARALLKRSFPFGVLFRDFRRRKLRVLLLRVLLRIGLGTGTWRFLRGLLLRAEYRAHMFRGVPLQDSSSQVGKEASRPAL